MPFNLAFIKLKLNFNFKYNYMKQYYIIQHGTPPGFKDMENAPVGAILDSIQAVKKPTVTELKKKKAYQEIIDFEVVSPAILKKEFEVDGNYFYKKKLPLTT